MSLSLFSLVELVRLVAPAVGPAHSKRWLTCETYRGKFMPQKVSGLLAQTVADNLLGSGHTPMSVISLKKMVEL